MRFSVDLIFDSMAGDLAGWAQCGNQYREEPMHVILFRVVQRAIPAICLILVCELYPAIVRGRLSRSVRSYEAQISAYKYVRVGVSPCHVSFLVAYLYLGSISTGMHVGICPSTE